jgi:Rhodopirellula transposase DDE domain
VTQRNSPARASNRGGPSKERLTILEQSHWAEDTNCALSAILLKCNPIDHRVFPHVTRACQGIPLDLAATTDLYMSKTTTTKGLKVFVRIIEKVFSTGRVVTEDTNGGLSLNDCLQVHVFELSKYVFPGDNNVVTDLDNLCFSTNCEPKSPRSCATA